MCPNLSIDINSHFYIVVENTIMRNRRTSKEA